ncbi:MAG: hypothetical protein ACLFTW_08460, partial [Chitinispirillaceae bacterium]
QTVRLLEILLDKFGISTSVFFDTVSRLNDRSINCFHRLIDFRAVSMVKIPLTGNNFKIYARPYKTGNGFRRPEKLQQFLINLYGCSEKDLGQHIWNMWVSYDFGSGRTTVSTQNDELKTDL